MLSTDAYQLTMAQLYLRAGLHERRVRFEHFFRSYPDYGEHRAGYCVAAGLGPFAAWMTSVRARPADVDALRGAPLAARRPVVRRGVLLVVRRPRLRRPAPRRRPRGSRRARQHADLGVEGDLAAAQLIETPLLNQLNFATLIATKAARVVEASHGRPVLEFGMRRAAAEGADAASRASIVGGAVSTSNSAVGYELGLTPAGTHAHSMVQLFIALGEGEDAAFDAYADVYPDDTLLLVDTVDTLGSGVPNAIATFERLRRRGHAPVGIRLDSGDLAFLAVEAARELDRAGFPDTVIVLSSQLDELTIWQITAQIAAEARRHGMDPDAVIGRLVFGVGSRLATSHGDPSLDGVYKLVAVDDGAGTWRPSMKRSDSPGEGAEPRRQALVAGVRRARRGHGRRAVGGRRDARAGVVAPAPPRPTGRRADRAPSAPSTSCSCRSSTAGRSSLDGLDDLAAAAARRVADVERFDPGVRRLVNPHEYHVSITDAVFDLKAQLLADCERLVRRPHDALTDPAAAEGAQDPDGVVGAVLGHEHVVVESSRRARSPGCPRRPAPSPRRR